jgi:hypothetical protein
MNHISTSPLIFNEEYDPLLCLFRGNKRVVLVNTNKYPDVRQVSRNRSLFVNRIIEFLFVKYVVPKNRQSPGRLVNPDR